MRPNRRLRWGLRTDHRVICGNPNPAPVPLVTRIETSDGRGHTYSKHYDYYNARYLPGVPSESEHLGFRRITVVDEQLNQETSLGTDRTSRIKGV